MGYREADVFTPPTRHEARARADPAGQSLPSGVFTILNQWVEDADTDGYFAPAPNDDRFTIPAGQAGLYLLTLNTNLTRTGPGCSPAPCRLGAEWLSGGIPLGSQHTKNLLDGQNSCGMLRSLVAGDFAQPRANAVGFGEPGAVVNAGQPTGAGTYMSLIRLDT